ncbi:MAG: hypothetical protein ACD_28C00169G0002 [uncultured bacterium]|nr:MAG: hypothetical protein ACD_28C00169G0002 [uncultured bacterium]KKT74061.1 MAG: hypothetical protein UW70_C0068G0014 [Candidatus Peregrinibacteria bacterium GW2011_GWA2_44_7]
MNSSTPGHLSLIAALLLFGFTGWYGMTQFNALSAVQADLAEADGILLDLESDKQKALKSYQDSNKQALDDQVSQQEKINSIFPIKEDLNNLTRMLDDFALKNHYESNPFFINQLVYGEITTPDGNNAYGFIPVAVTLETSERNFYKFLEYIENSGSIENGIRIMSINGISLQRNSESKTLRVQLSIAAYLQSV